MRSSRTQERTTTTHVFAAVFVCGTHREASERAVRARDVRNVIRRHGTQSAASARSRNRVKCPIATVAQPDSLMSGAVSWGESEKGNFQTETEKKVLLVFFSVKKRTRKTG